MRINLKRVTVALAWCAALGFAGCETLPDQDDPRVPVPVRDAGAPPNGTCSGVIEECFTWPLTDCGPYCTLGRGCVGSPICNLRTTESLCSVGPEDCTWAISCVGGPVSPNYCRELFNQSGCEEIRGCTWTPR